MERRQRALKLVIIGDSGVGKTSLLHQLSNGTFCSVRALTIVDIAHVKMEIDSDDVSLTVVDTAGTLQYHEFTSGMLNGAHGVVIVYDIGDTVTLQNVAVNWCNILKRDSNRLREHYQVILVGNKSDTERSVSQQMAARVATANQWSFIEVSAKTGDQVRAAFELLIRSILKECFKPAITGTISASKLSSGSAIHVQPVATKEPLLAETGAPATINLAETSNTTAQSSSGCGC